ncbi:MAG: cytochrome c oxidase assembly protein [Gaiellaceae bacterium]
MIGASLLTSWSVEPATLLAAAVLAFAYARRARTLARRGQTVPRWRIAIFAAGIVLMLLAIASPIDAVGEDDLFALHMTQHLLLGDIVPMCLLAGTTGPLLQPLLARLPVRELRALATPYVALPIWALNLGLWFLPGVFDAAEAHPLVHVAFHLSLLTAGTIMWLPVFETLPAPEWFGTGAKLGYILVVRSVGMIFANVLVWASSPFYEPYKSGGSHYGISPLADQQLAGGVMLLYDSLLTLVAIAWLFLRMAQESEVRQQLLERGLDERAVRRAVRYGRWRELMS